MAARARRGGGERRRDRASAARSRWSWRAAGYPLALLGRREGAARADPGGGRAGGDGLALPCDVRDAAAVARGGGARSSGAGAPPRCVVPAAGVAAIAPLEETCRPTPSRETVDTNLTGTFLLLRALLPGMKRAGERLDLPDPLVGGHARASRAGRPTAPASGGWPAWWRRCARSCAARACDRPRSTRAPPTRRSGTGCRASWDRAGDGAAARGGPGRGLRARRRSLGPGRRDPPRTRGRSAVSRCLAPRSRRSCRCWRRCPAAGWLFPLLAPLTLYPVLPRAGAGARLLRRLAARRSLWAFLLSAGVDRPGLLDAGGGARRHPGTASPTAQEMFGWIATGEGRENDWRAVPADAPAPPRRLPGPDLGRAAATSGWSWAPPGRLHELLRRQLRRGERRTRSSAPSPPGCPGRWCGCSPSSCSARLFARPLLVRRLWPFERARGPAHGPGRQPASWPTS